MSQFKKLELLAWRKPSAIGVAITSLPHSGMVTCLERLWRLLLPAIFSILPEEWRRIIHLASGTPTPVPIV
jgi:hypothetical protein